MLKTKSESFSVVPPVQIRIISDGPFVVYALRKKKRYAIMGPMDETKRRLDFVCNKNLEDFEVAVHDGTCYTVDFLHMAGAEDLDPTPVEVPVEQPINFQQEIKRMIRDEFSRIAENNGLETLEEANNFGDGDDDDDGDEEPFTDYELAELQDEFVHADEESGGTDPAGGNVDRDAGEREDEQSGNRDNGEVRPGADTLEVPQQSIDTQT